MNLFDNDIKNLHKYIEIFQSLKKLKNFNAKTVFDWPVSGKKDIVFKEDVCVELGNPQDESVSFLMWTTEPKLIRDQNIMLIGPDIKECKDNHVPFGKIVLIYGNDFNELNAYDRYKEMALKRYDISLKGYMMRAVSQYMREWSRISKEAFSSGFSFQIMGKTVIDEYKKLEYIKGVEVLFVTESCDAVLKLKEIGGHVMRCISAMTKMSEELSLDCDGCEYNDVCSDVSDLRSMRNNTKIKDRR